MRALIYFALIAGAIAAPPASAAPLDLTPTSKWQVDYSADSCKLARSFGAGDDKVVLWMERFQPGPSFDLVLTGKPVRGWSEGRVRYAFGPGIELKTANSAMGGELDDKTPVLMLGLRSLPIKPVTDADYDGEDPEPPKTDLLANDDAVRELVVERAGKRVRLDLGPMAAPMAAFATCVDELVTHWGLDPAQQATLVTRPVPIGNPGKWLGSNDYPARALFDGKQAIIDFRLNIGADGKPASCHIQATTNPPDFGPRSCELLMKRATFTPARDADGAGAPSYYINRVRWIIAD